MSQTNLSATETEEGNTSSVSISKADFRGKVPDPVSGIQYNFCKNPKCENFGVPASTDKTERRGKYTMVSGGKNFPLLKCVACGETPPLKSNQGIVEEIDRLTGYLRTNIITCPNEACENHHVPLGTKKAYRSFGVARSGAVRHQCTKCKKTFSIPKPTQYQHDTHQNKMIFKMLVNNVPFRRIVHMLDIPWSTFYRRIDFIHKQCMAFVADRERRLADMPIKELHIAIDRQEHLVNWSYRDDKRNVNLDAITTSDNLTGYVFGMHSNFDYSLDNKTVQVDALNSGDASVSPPYRKYARLWLNMDYVACQMRSSEKKLRDSSLRGEIEAQYDTAMNRIDVEKFDEKTFTEKLPDAGMQVHAEYTMIAHFHFLKRLMGNVGKWRFYMDQESGIRSACFSAFHKEVSERTAEAFYVKYTKDMVQEDRIHIMENVKKAFNAVCKANPTLSEHQIKLNILKSSIAAKKALGGYKDLWVEHPLPMMSEPEKAMCWLTEHSGLKADGIASLYLYASLHSVDSYFNKVRRRIKMCERPIHSQGNNGRIWSAYQAYRPEVLVKLLEIFRVVHNYVDLREENVKKGKSAKGKVQETANEPPKKVKTTPAMNLGLANAPLDYGDILYYQSN